MEAALASPEEACFPWLPATESLTSLRELWAWGGWAGLGGTESAGLLPGVAAGGGADLLEGSR